MTKPANINTHLKLVDWWSFCKTECTDTLWILVLCLELQLFWVSWWLQKIMWKSWSSVADFYTFFFLLCWPWDNIVWPSIINCFDSLWPSCLNPSLGTHEILQKLSFSISFFWQQNIFLCQIFLIQSYVFVEDYASAALYLLVLLHLHLEKLIILINCTHSYCHNPNNCASVCGCCKTFFICIQAAITPFSHCHAHMFVPYWCLSCHISNRQPQVA